MRRPNMNYCKWENTAAALRQCLNSLEDGETEDDYSEYEKIGKKSVMNMVATIYEDYLDGGDSDEE